MNKFTTLYEKFFHKEDKEMQNLARCMPGFISPNLLSLLRLVILLPIILTILNKQYGFSAFLFLFAYFLDILDGALARAKKQITRFGKLFDPLVDKVIFISVLLLLALDRLPDFLIYSMVFLEVLIILLVIIGKPMATVLKLKIKMEANIYGKIKMFFQVLGITILFLLITANHKTTLATIIFIIATFFSALSIVNHLLTIRKIKM